MFLVIIWVSIFFITDHILSYPFETSYGWRISSRTLLNWPIIFTSFSMTWSRKELSWLLDLFYYVLFKDRYSFLLLGIIITFNWLLLNQKFLISRILPAYLGEIQRNSPKMWVIASENNSTTNLELSNFLTGMSLT